VSDTEQPLPFSRLRKDEAITVLFRREHARLVAYARLLVDDVPTAEDVVQDAFGGLHRHWAGLSDEHKALSYLRTAVVNGARSQLRRRRTVLAFRPARPDDEPSAEALAVRHEQHRLVLAGLAKLPLRQREVLVLRYFFDLTEAQIADELAISKGSVKQHASRGIAALSTRVGVAT
jgi:RNA polymerase sigma-70 factor (sigma-E family)